MFESQLSHAQYAESTSVVTGLEKKQAGVLFFSWSLLRPRDVGLALLCRGT